MPRLQGLTTADMIKNAHDKVKKAGEVGVNLGTVLKSEVEQTQPQEPVYEAPKRNIITEGLKIAGQGLESYAGGRLREAEQESEQSAKQTYQKKLKDFNTTRHERLREKINNGTATPAEVKEYRDREKLMHGDAPKKKGSLTGLNIQDILNQED